LIKEIGLGILIAVGLIVAGYFGIGMQEPSTPSNDIDTAAEAANMQACQRIKDNLCLENRRGNNINKSDYPDSCFTNGENIVENPYTCQEEP
jgi:hypothetical protein